MPKARRSHQAIGEDITEYKEAEEALRESGARLKSIFRAAPIGIGLVSSRVLLEVNDRICEMTGYSREELIGKNARVLYPTDEDYEHVGREKYDQIRECGTGTVETRFIRKDGTIIDVLLSSTTLDPNDLSAGVTFTALDITERKEAEEELRQYESIVASSNDMIALLNRDFIYLATNDAYVSAFGKAKDEVIGHTVGEVFGKEFFKSVIKPHAERCLAGEEVHYDDWFNFPVYGRRYMDISYFPYPGDGKEIRGFVVYGRNITKRKRTEQALRESEQKYRSLIANIPDVVWTSDENGNTAFISANVEDIFGYSPEEVYREGDRLWFGRIHPDDREKVKGSFKAVFEEGQQLDVEYRIQRKDGQWIWLQDRSIGAYEKDGIKYADGVFCDVTNRKKAEVALRESEETTAALLNATSDSALLIDSQGNVIAVNKSMAERLGTTPEEIVGTLIFDYLPPDLVKPRMAKGSEAARTGKPVRFEDQRAGRWLENSVFPVFTAQGEVSRYAIYSRDITERKKAEERTREHQAELLDMSRLTTVGEMASGLAHELNQPLCAAVNYTNACLHRIMMGEADTDKLIESMRAAVKQTERAGEIVNSIKSFVKKHEPHKSTVDINELVRKLPDFVATNIRRNKVSFNLALAEQVPTILVNPVQIEQVLVNLILNAIEAMSDVEAEKRQLTIQTSSTDHCVEIAVSDTGKGVPDEACEKIFNSFFTTKPDGMGIGLSISKTIVEAHKGRIWADKGIDCGATFRFTLPSAETKL
jgi:PAS domain S-box-containing protein